MNFRIEAWVAPISSKGSNGRIEYSNNHRILKERQRVEKETEQHMMRCREHMDVILRQVKQNINGFSAASNSEEPTDELENYILPIWEQLKLIAIYEKELEKFVEVTDTLWGPEEDRKENRIIPEHHSWYLEESTNV